MMLKGSPGDYITLDWDAGPTTEYVHGHVTRDEFINALVREGIFWPNDAASPKEETKDIEIRHVYARPGNCLGLLK